MFCLYRGADDGSWSGRWRPDRSRAFPGVHSIFREAFPGDELSGHGDDDWRSGCSSSGNAGAWTTLRRTPTTAETRRASLATRRTQSQNRFLRSRGAHFSSLVRWLQPPQHFCLGRRLATKKRSQRQTFNWPRNAEACPIPVRLCPWMGCQPNDKVDQFRLPIKSANKKIVHRGSIWLDLVAIRSLLWTPGCNTFTIFLPSDAKW